MELQQNGSQRSVAEMPTHSSLRPDFTGAGQTTDNCLCPERHRDKSGPRELITRDCATDVWHPFGCSSQSGTTSSFQLDTRSPKKADQRLIHFLGCLFRDDVTRVGNRAQNDLRNQRDEDPHSVVGHHVI